MPFNKEFTVQYHTFGCKLNFSETSSIAATLEQHGAKRALRGQTPDICVINSCSVTEQADKKCRQLLRSLSSKYPQALIVVTGCYAQLKPEQIKAIPGVHVVVGTDKKLSVPEYIYKWLESHDDIVEVTPTAHLRTFSPSCSRGDRTRYFLKVQDGCDYFCSYCTIPFARGRSRNGSIESLVKQAEQTAQEGGKEIVITGVNIGDFGKSTGETFLNLIQELDKVQGIERYRISSIEPDLLTDEIIEFVAQSRAFMPHFHIPLQSGTDEVLKLMRRHYDTALFAEKILRIKHLMPHAFIGVDVIAGARGETEELFQQSLKFISDLPVSRLHAFPYSERPGTLALNINSHIVDQRTKTLRTNQLISLSDSKLLDFSKQFIGQVRPVLFEQPQPGRPMHGFTDNYLKVVAPLITDCINNVVNVRLTRMIDINEIEAEVII